jgi:hypothetical protein
VYGGWYWRQAYDWAPFIGAQLLFAYAFDMLLTWSRRDRYLLGFGPFPIISSINLFLWFKNGLVLSAAHDGRRWFLGKGVPPLDQEWQASPHLQPLVISAGAVFVAADRHPQNEHHVG